MDESGSLGYIENLFDKCKAETSDTRPKERTKSPRKEEYNTSKDRPPDYASDTSQSSNTLNIKKHLSPQGQRFLDHRSDLTMSEKRMGSRDAKSSELTTKRIHRTPREEQLLKPLKGVLLKETDPTKSIPIKRPQLGIQPRNDLAQPSNQMLRSGISQSRVVSNGSANRLSEEVVVIEERSPKRQRTEMQSREGHKNSGSSVHSRSKRLERSTRSQESPDLSNEALTSRGDHAKSAEVGRGKLSSSALLSRTPKRDNSAALSESRVANTNNRKFRLVTTRPDQQRSLTEGTPTLGQIGSKPKRQGRSYFMPLENGPPDERHRQPEDSADELAGPSGYDDINIIIPSSSEFIRNEASRKPRSAGGAEFSYRVRKTIKESRVESSTPMTLRLTDRQKSPEFVLFNERKEMVPFFPRRSEVEQIAFTKGKSGFFLVIQASPSPVTRYFDIADLSSAKRFLKDFRQVWPNKEIQCLSIYDFENRLSSIQSKPSLTMLQEDLEPHSIPMSTMLDSSPKPKKPKLRDRLEPKKETKSPYQSDSPRTGSNGIRLKGSSIERSKTSLAPSLLKGVQAEDGQHNSKLEELMRPSYTEHKSRDVHDSQSFPRLNLDRAEDIDDIVSEVPNDRKYSLVYGFGRPWTRPLIFPSIGRNRTTIEFQDLPRLDEGEFLNDSIIDFYIRYLSERQPNAQVYCFNTFFFTSLSQGKTGFKGINYEAVKNWTRNVKIFDYDYLVVPINESLHWYVAIICNLQKLKWSAYDHPPDLHEDDQRADSDEGCDDIIIDSGQPVSSSDIETMNNGDESQDELSSVPGEVRVFVDRASDLLTKEPTKSGITTELSGAKLLKKQLHSIHKPTSNSGDSRISSAIAANTAGRKVMASDDYDQPDSLEDTNSFSTDARTITLFKPDPGPAISKSTDKIYEAQPKQKKRKSISRLRTYNPDTVAIITLDSLGASHPSTIKMLKSYLAAEAVDKLKRDLDGNKIQGLTGKGIPGQDNYSDCGIYLLLYLEKFLKDPRRFATKLLKKNLTEADWPDTNVVGMRDELRKLIINMHDAQENGSVATRDVEQPTPVALARHQKSRPFERPETAIKDIRKDDEQGVTALQIDASAPTVMKDAAGMNPDVQNTNASPALSLTGEQTRLIGKNGRPQGNVHFVHLGTSSRGIWPSERLESKHTATHQDVPGNDESSLSEANNADIPGRKAPLLPWDVSKVPLGLSFMDRNLPQDESGDKDDSGLKQSAQLCLPRANHTSRHFSNSTRASEMPASPPRPRTRGKRPETSPANTYSKKRRRRSAAPEVSGPEVIAPEIIELRDDE